jgi:hypothetical protein
MIQKPNYDKGFPSERKPEDKETKKGKLGAEGEEWKGGRSVFRVVSKKGKKMHK